MPEMDGQTAIQEIRAIEEAGGTISTNGAKIIMTTALDDVKNVVQSFQLVVRRLPVQTNRHRQIAGPASGHWICYRESRNVIG